MDRSDSTLHMSYDSCINILKAVFKDNPQVRILEMDKDASGQLHYIVIADNEEKSDEIGAIMNLPLQTGNVAVKRFIIGSEDNEFVPENSIGIEVFENTVFDNAREGELKDRREK